MKNTIYILTPLVLGIALFSGAYLVSASEIVRVLSTEGLIPIVPPTASPLEGVYTSTQNVILSGGEKTVSIHYTTDGSLVTCTSGSVYSTPIVVSSSLVIGAISCYPNNITSSVAIFGYVINPPAPAPSGGSSSGGGGGITTTSTTADPNGDGKVDIFDFNILMIHWGTVPSGGSSADFNSDGVIDIFDFNLLMINWTG